MSTLPREVGVINHNDSAESASRSESNSANSRESASKLRRLESYDLLGEIGDLVERTSHEQKGTKALAGELDAAYSTVRDWTARPERFPLAKLPRLLALAPADEGFLDRLVKHLGYQLLPLDPSPSQIAAILARHGLIAKEARADVAVVLRGIKADPRQALLGFDE